MGRPSKFTAECRQKILEALKVGASRGTAAAVAGIGEATLRDWMARAKTSTPDSRYAAFAQEVIEAEAHPKMRALGVIYKEMPDNAGLAWKYIERRESGFAPPMPQAVQAPPQVRIQLSFHDGGSLAASTVQSFIEGEVIEQDEESSPRALPAPSPSA